MKRRVFITNCQEGHPNPKDWDIPDDKIYGTAINLSIEIRICRGCSTYWVPRWITQAGKIYRTQEHGYAGLGLYTFLKKMGATG